MPSDPVLRAKFDCRRGINGVLESVEAGTCPGADIDKIIYMAKNRFMVPDAYPEKYIREEWLNKKRLRLDGRILVRQEEIVVRE